MNNLEQLDRTKELIEILWDINTECNRDEKDWERVELLLECYEARRNKYLSSALSDLERLRQIVTR